MKLYLKPLMAAITAALLAGTLPALAQQARKDTHKAEPAAKEQQPWGIAGDPKAVTRTIEIVMTDNMRFTPARIEIRQGEMVKFVVKNGGKVLHEMVLGTKAELDKHAALMVKLPGMEHDEPHMVHVKPRKSQPLVWNFNRAGEFQFACLIPGHYQAGMVGTIVVRPSTNQGNNS